MTTQPQPTAADKTVLICEDDPILRTLVRLALGDDYRYFEAPDGPSGLALAERTDPDLIVLDVLRELRGADEFTETRVIVISAWSDSDEAAIAAGANHFLAKPFDPDELRDAAVALLEDGGARG